MESSSNVAEWYSSLRIILLRQTATLLFPLLRFCALQNDALSLLLVLRLRARTENGSGRVSAVTRQVFWPVAYRMASSKTLFNFRCVKAEHSRYFCALISLATMT